MMAGFVRLFFVGLLAAAPAAPQALRWKGSRQMTSDERLVLNRLEGVEQTGSLGGMTIEIWSGGGQPPPYYKSEQLRFMSSAGRDVLEFASLRFDSKFDPQAVQDK